MLDKIMFFFLKKKVETATGSVDQVSKTKIFMLIEGILRAIEFASPYFGHPYTFPPSVHTFLYALAGVAFRDSMGATPSTDNPPVVPALGTPGK